MGRRGNLLANFSHVVMEGTRGLGKRLERQDEGSCTAHNYKTVSCHRLQLSILLASGNECCINTCHFDILTECPKVTFQLLIITRRDSERLLNSTLAMQSTDITTKSRSTEQKHVNYQYFKSQKENRLFKIKTN